MQWVLIIILMSMDGDVTTMVGPVSGPVECRELERVAHNIVTVSRISTLCWAFKKEKA